MSDQVKTNKKFADKKRERNSFQNTKNRTLTMEYARKYMNSMIILAASAAITVGLVAAIV